MVKAVGSETVYFQRESLPPMLLREVLYVHGLKKNLVSVSAIEERGYEVLFRDGHVLLFLKGSSITSAKVIGSRHEKLYKLMFQPARALFNSTNSNDLCELCALDHSLQKMGLSRESPLHETLLQRGGSPSGFRIL